MKTWADDILNIAHRGASGHAPENTMAAFERAYELGADGVECDVQLTLDGHPIIFHDESLHRTTDGKGKVADTSLDVLKHLDAGRWFAPEFAGESVPTLEDVLDFAKGRYLLNIEIKTTPQPRLLVERVVQSIVSFDVIDHCLITSFDVESVRWAMKLLPECPSGVVIKKRSSDVWLEEWPFLAVKSNIVNAALMEQLKRYKKSLIVWTVNETAELRNVYALGARRIITNFPDRYKKVIEKSEKNID